MQRIEVAEKFLDYERRMAAERQAQGRPPKDADKLDTQLPKL